MDNDQNKDARAQRFWRDYARSARVSGAEFTAFAFGDSSELADELLGLIMAGAKRATASLPRDYTAPGERVPEQGDLNVILDGNNVPRCIIRILQVQVKPMRDVDEHFAWDEGEGDRSLAWWMAAHTRYFTKQGVREGFTFSDSTELVLQRFEVVWPLELADQPSAATSI